MTPERREEEKKEKQKKHRESSVKSTKEKIITIQHFLHLLFTSSLLGFICCFCRTSVCRLKILVLPR